MKKYLVRLTDPEREICCEVIRKLKGTSQKVRRAQMLLKAEHRWPGVDGRPNCRCFFLPHKDRRECSTKICRTRF